MRLNVGWIALTIAALGAAALAVLFVITVGTARLAEREIESLTFHQYQAILDFDDAEYVQDDPAQVARFQALLTEYDVVPDQTVTAVEDGCDGGLSTTVELAYADGGSAEMFLATCGEPAYDEFNAQATELFTQWRLEQHPAG